ncbi:MAG: TonB-dependent receptor [Alphaproteobacteria bacterium HGW-Alphaproteobacteria-11]|nr:MAG: TonB-dependent receptor [Alphaproteobacteria bacterium HGW-Alphaproteobacteria-11]
MGGKPAARAGWGSETGVPVSEIRVALTRGAAALALSMALAAGAAAQDEPPVLDDLIVTTTGFGTPRATHIGNISRIGGDEADFVLPLQPAEALNRLPGLAIQQGSGAEHLTAIRSPVLTAGAGAGSFLYLEDGVPMRAAGFANVNALMEAMDEVSGGIEVVRGPGSARYGSNAEHGLINFLSRPPAPDADAELTAWGGPYGRWKTIGTASRTLRGDGLTTHGFRGSFSAYNDDGFRAASGLDQQKARLRYDFATPGTRGIATLTAVNFNQETAGFVVGPKAYKDPALYRTNPNPEAYRDAWAVRAALRLEHDIADGRMLVLTPYVRQNDMDFLMHFLPPGKPREENGHWSGGLLASLVADLDGGHRLIFGFDTEYSDGYLKEIQDLPTMGTMPQGTHYDYTVKALVLAPYIHSEWKLSPATLLSAGLRLEYTRYDYANRTANGITGRFLRIPDTVDEFTDATPKLGLLHIFNDSLTGYVNVARGSRAPQTTDLYRLQSLQVPGEAKSEVLDSIEIGARGQVGVLRYETNVYYMKKKNFYFRDANGFNVSNGKTNHFGVEGEFSAPLGAGFDIAGAATWARHTYAFDNIIGPGINATETIRDGDDVDTAPRTIAGLRLGYNFHEGAARAELEWVHMGSYWMDAANTVKYDGHDIFNLRLDYQATESLALFGKLTNILDRRYADRADFAFGSERYFPGEDRGLTLGGTVRF